MIEDKNTDKKLLPYLKLFFYLPSWFFSLVVLFAAIGYLVNTTVGASWCVIAIFVLRFIVLPVSVLICEEYIKCTDISQDASPKDKALLFRIELIEGLIRILFPLFGIIYGAMKFKIFGVILGLIFGVIFGFILSVLWTLLACSIVKRK